MKNLISVLIAAYNHEYYIQETINSIIEQTYQDLELIVVDDGSTDNTWQKINAMKEICEKRFNRVIFKTQENGCTSETLNSLISLSKGDYIYLIASDDLAKPHAIQKLFDFLSPNPDYALVVGDNEIIDEHSKRIYWDENRNNLDDEKTAKYKTFAEFLQGERKDINFNSDDFGTYHSLVEMNYIPNGVLIRKNIFEKIGLFTKEAPLDDYYLMLQIAKYSKMKFINEILFSYRWHSDNTIKKSKRIVEFVEKTKEYERTLVKNTEKTNYSREIQKYIKNGQKSFQIGIPFFFEFYKVKNLFFKKSCIRILGVKINIKNIKRG